MAQGINWNFLPYNDEERKLAELEQLQEANARIPETLEAVKKWELNDASVKMLNTPEVFAAVQAERDAPILAYQEREADMKRIAELQASLEKKRAKISSDPNFRMAAMLAMAGQPGALQALISTSGKSDSAVQKEMDALEDKMANDIFALTSANPAQFDKITGALIPLYESRFNELVGKGGKSRLGWDAWKNAISGAKGKRAASNAKANAAKAAAKSLSDAMANGSY
jgi:hypothetical protein